MDPLYTHTDAALEQAFIRAVNECLTSALYTDNRVSGMTHWNEGIATGIYFSMSAVRSPLSFNALKVLHALTMAVAMIEGEFAGKMGV